MGLRLRKDPASPLKSKLGQDKLRGRGTEMAVTTGEAGSSRQQVSPVFPSRWPADGPQGVDPGPSALPATRGRHSPVARPPPLQSRERWPPPCSGLLPAWLTRRCPALCRQAELPRHGARRQPREVCAKPLLPTQKQCRLDGYNCLSNGKGNYGHLQLAERGCAPPGTAAVGWGSTRYVTVPCVCTEDGPGLASGGRLGGGSRRASA